MTTKQASTVKITGVNLTKMKSQLFAIANKEMLGENDINATYREVYSLIGALIESATNENFNLDFIANLILFTKNDMKIRQFPIAATVAFLHCLQINKKTYPNSRKLVCAAITRADELADMYAIAVKTFGNKKSVPMAIKRGVADAFNKFNEYSFGKYKNGNTVFSLKDVLLVTHPTPNDDKLSKVFEKIRDETLSTPVTWEVALSENGKLPLAMQRSKCDIWTELLSTEKLGYIALIRNIRNILEAGVSENVIKQYWCNKISDENIIRKSGILPFQIYNAYNNVEAIAKSNKAGTLVLDAIEAALDISLCNVPVFGNNVLIIHDVSGSMSGSKYNDLSPAHYSALFASALYLTNKNGNIDLIQFSNDATNVTPTGSTVLQLFKSIYKSGGGGTNVSAAFKRAQKNKIDYDTILVLSDGDINLHDVKDYTDASLGLKSGCTKICFNFDNNGKHVLTEDIGWLQVTGHSDRLFEFIKTSKTVDAISKYLSVAFNAYK